jgi:hypothetical protein
MRDKIKRKLSQKRYRESPKGKLKLTNKALTCVGKGEPPVNLG